MGAKPVFKRYKNLVYFTYCIIISLFLSSCQHFPRVRLVPSQIDKNENNYLKSTNRFVLSKDFKSASRKNKNMVGYYETLPHENNITVSNYLQNARIISMLLTRIMEDKEKILSNGKQIKSLTYTVKLLKRKLNTQKKDLTDLETLSKRIEILEKEKKLLERQIHQLKEIDLNPGKIIGNPVPFVPGHKDKKNPSK